MVVQERVVVSSDGQQLIMESDVSGAATSKKGDFILLLQKVKDKIVPEDDLHA